MSLLEDILSFLSLHYLFLIIVIIIVILIIMTFLLDLIRDLLLELSIILFIPVGIITACVYFKMWTLLYFTSSVILSIWVFSVYNEDKMAATHSISLSSLTGLPYYLCDVSRTPELCLLLATQLSPVAAFLSMVCLWHKVRKPRFWGAICISLCLHVYILLWTMDMIPYKPAEI